MANNKNGRTDKGSGKGAAVAALIISIAALVFSMMAYNRAGNLEDAVQARIDEVANELNVGVARLEASGRLAAAKIKYEADDNSEDFINTMDEIKSNLAAAYQKAGTNASNEWREFQAEFDNIERDVRNQASSALASLENLIGRLKQNIRVE